MSLRSDSISLLSTGGYSARVRLHLVVNGTEIPLSQVGPHRLVLQEPVELSARVAEVRIEIDGEVDRWPVELVEMLAGSRDVAIRLVA